MSAIYLALIVAGRLGQLKAKFRQDVCLAPYHVVWDLSRSPASQVWLPRTSHHITYSITDNRLKEIPFYRVGADTEERQFFTFPQHNPFYPKVAI